MSTEARPDPVAARFQPNPELVARAQRAMMADEDAAGGSVRYVRQRWEEAFAAVRVAVMVLREIYPAERDAMDADVREGIALALRHASAAYEDLDDLSAGILGPTMHDVLTGKLDTHEQLDIREVPR